MLNKAAILKFTWDSLNSSSSWGILFRARFKVSTFRYSLSYIKSSVWPGIKEILPCIFQHCRWIIGNGKLFNFWHSRWLSESLLGQLHVSIPNLQSLVNAVIKDQQWNLPQSFVQSFPAIAAAIQRIELPHSSIDDNLIWEWMDIYHFEILIMFFVLLQQQFLC